MRPNHVLVFLSAALAWSASALPSAAASGTTTGEDLRFHQIGEREVDDAVSTADWNRGLGPVFGQWTQTRAYGATSPDP